MKRSVVLITGATSGIGLATAKLLKNKNYRVVVNGRNPDTLKEVAEAIGCDSFFGDITNDSIPERMMEYVLNQYGQCDILVNNAGMITNGTIEEIDLDQVCRMMRVNVEATFRMSYLFLKHCIQRNQGHLINLSSIMGRKVRPTVGAYAGSKHAVEALSEALRMELSHTPVKITCIQPGLVKTELHRHWKVHPAELLKIPEPLVPQDIADTILWVLNQKDHVRIPEVLVMPKDHAL